MPVHRGVRAAVLALLGVLLTSASASAVTFTEEAGSPYATGANPYTTVAADFNGDGRTDLATVNGTSSNVSVFLRRPTGGFAEEAGSPVAVGLGPSKAAAGDFNGDGRTDLAVANYSDGSVTILLRQAGGGFVQEAGSPVVVGGGPGGIAAGDLNGDGRTDLAVPQLDSGTVTVLTRNAGAGFTAAGTYGTGAAPRDVGIADFDGDGRPDLAVVDRDADNVTILLRQAGGSYAAAPGSPVPVGDAPQAIAIGDFTGDGRPDFAVTDNGADTLSIYDRNAGNTGFTQEAGSPFVVGSGPVGLATADLDGDGRLDLVFSEQVSSQVVDVLRRPDNGGFTTDHPSATTSPAGPNGLAVGDFDGDGHVDVAVVSDSASRLHVYRNTTGNPPASIAPPAIAGTPQVGTVLTCSPGSFSNSPSSYLYVWERGGRGAGPDDPSWTPLDGAGSDTYNIAPGDEGSRVRCRVTAINGGGSASAVSASLRVDAGVPVNVVPPRTLGDPITEKTLTCDPGTWQRGPDLTYRWLRDGTAIAGQTGATFVNQFPEDTDDHVGCEVTGTNDVGASAPVRANALHVVAREPVTRTSPHLDLDVASTNPVGRTATCQHGDWRYDDGNYSYQWARDGSVMSGVAGPTYVTTLEDLGRMLQCQVVNTNAAGSSHPSGSNEVLVPLPRGTGNGRIYKAGGHNEFDPINMMALSGEYADAVSGLLVPRLQRAVAKQTTACQTMKGVPATAPKLTFSDFPITPAVRCAILLHDAGGVDVGTYGVQYTHVVAPGQARAAQSAAVPCGPGSGTCPDLGFHVDPVDPSNAGVLDPDLQAELDPVTPVTVLWDFNGDHRTDAECAPGAPVVRTMFDRGKWTARATIVAKNSVTTGIYGSATITFDNPENSGVKFTGGSKTTLRAAQPFACQTSILPPADPEVSSCIRSATIGLVQVTGNLCPIYLRAIDPAVLAHLPADVYTTLKAFASQLAVASRARAVDRSRNGVAVDLDGVTPAGAPSAPDLRAAGAGGGVFAHAADAAPDDPGGDADPDDETTVAAFTNTVSALSGFDADHTVPIDPYAEIPGTLLSDLEAKLTKKKFDKDKANFALDEIYFGKGKMKINGVTVTPQTAIDTLLVPTDVGNAVNTIKSMTINNPSVKTVLGGLELATGQKIEAQIPDAKTAGQAVLQQLDLDHVRDQLKAEADKLLNIGPFHLTGADADVKLNADGTATVTATAQIPLLKDPASKKPIGLKITLNGDKSGHLSLQGVELRAPAALLGPVRVKDLFLKYGDGLQIQGKILFTPNGEGVDIQDFRIDDAGDLQALRLAYLAGAGSGIPIGPGIYLTKVQGGLDLGPPTYIDAGATVSVGPSAGGGCPTAGVDAQLDVTWGQAPPAPAVAVDFHGDVELVCIKVGNAQFHADSDGLVTLHGGLALDAGPLSLRADVGAKVKLPDWQVSANATAAIHDIPIIGTISGGVKMALSNLGLAACGEVEIWPLGHVGGGAGVRFSHGIPPLTLIQLIASVDVFTGCDLSDYLPLGQSASVAAHGAQAGASTFTMPAGAGGTILSIEGAGAAPRVALHAPGGKSYDFSTATTPVKLPGVGAQVMESQDRTVVTLKDPPAGRWSAVPVAGSPAVVRVRIAHVLPAPKVRVRVSGHGTRRTLSYTIAKLRGQRVRFAEDAPGGLKTIGTVKEGGRGKFRYLLGEANGTRRTIVAQVSQDGLPRVNLTVARYSAHNPKVGRPRVRVRRSGTRAIITWKPGVLATSYLVSALSSAGHRTAYLPPAKGRGARRVVVSGVGRSERLSVMVVGVSSRGSRSVAGRATLAAVKGKAKKGRGKAKAKGPKKPGGKKGPAKKGRH